MSATLLHRGERQCLGISRSVRAPVMHTLVTALKAAANLTHGYSQHPGDSDCPDFPPVDRVVEFRAAAIEEYRSACRFHSEPIQLFSSLFVLHLSAHLPSASGHQSS